VRRLTSIREHVKGSTMVERRVTVGWPEGLHARPASLFVRATTSLGIRVTIAKAGGDPVNAASMLAVLGLGARGGDEVVLASEADDSGAALDRLSRLVGEGLDELPA
jgi:phosphocarrier protein HPr